MSFWPSAITSKPEKMTGYFKKDRSMELEPVLVMPEVATSYGALESLWRCSAVEGAIA